MEETKPFKISKQAVKIAFDRVKANKGTIQYLFRDGRNSAMVASYYTKNLDTSDVFDILKNKLHLENFTGKTKITIEQDFYAQIYVFNVLQDIKNINTQRIQEKHCNKNLKYKYKPNFYLPSLEISIFHFS